MKKHHILIIIVLVLYAFIMFYFINHSNEERYLFLSDKTIITMRKNKWQISNVSEVKNMMLYNENQALGKFTLRRYENGYLLYDSSGKQYHNYSKTLVGYTKNMDIGVEKFERQMMNEEDIVELQVILDNLGIKHYTMLSSSEKVNYDFDNDGQNETIYAVSNTFLEDQYNQIFSLIYLRDNGKIKILYQEFGDLENIYEIGRPYLHAVVNYRKDKTFELIVGIEYFDQAGTRYQMYQFKNGNATLEFDLK